MPVIGVLTIALENRPPVAVYRPWLVRSPMTYAFVGSMTTGVEKATLFQAPGVSAPNVALASSVPVPPGSPPVTCQRAASYVPAPSVAGAYTRAPDTDPATLNFSVRPTVTGEPSETSGSVGVWEVKRDWLTGRPSLLREGERARKDLQGVAQVGALAGRRRAPQPPERRPRAVPDLHAHDRR